MSVSEVESLAFQKKPGNKKIPTNVIYGTCSAQHVKSHDKIYDHMIHMADDEAGTITCFKGGELVTEDGGLVSKDLWVRDGKILDPLHLFYEERKGADIIIDCSDLIISPGFIDIQINGAFGIDFSTLTEDTIDSGLAKVSNGLLQHGVTAYVPTIVTSASDYYKKILPLFTPREGIKNGAAVLGVHCEGPFISAEKKGAHEECFVQPILSPTKLQEVYGSNLDNIQLITLAPELDGGLEAVKWLKKKGDVVVSVGHSMANLQQAEQAVSNGASLITHLFNAMLPFHHRDPGIVGLLTSLKLEHNVYYGIISDGFHTHETVQRIAYNANPKGVVLVTDAVCAMGLPDGVHSFGTRSVKVKDGAARLTGTNTLAGSVASMDTCVRNFKNATNCLPGKAIVAATLHPARVLGLEKERGTLSYGARADLVILDHNLVVQATCITGKLVSCKQGSRFDSLL